MTPIRVLIVDDEPLARRRVRSMLSTEPDVDVIGECANGLEAVECIRRDDPDLVFLDVQMPELDGFGIIEGIGVDDMPVVIFVTAYDEHALRAFDVSALDYVLKPFDGERFLQALGRARKQIVLRRSGEGDVGRRLLRAVNELRDKAAYPKRLAVKSGGSVSFLPVDEIDWIEATGNYVRLHSGRQYQLMRKSLIGLAAQLDPSQFVRIHRSTLVNVARVREVRATFHGDAVVVLESGMKLKVSRKYRANLTS